MADYEYWDADTGEGLTDHELHELYDEMLDDIYGLVNVAGIERRTSYALQELDPIAYRCGFSDWIDGEVQNGALLDEEPEEEGEEELPEQYDWVGWEAEPEMTGDGSGDPEKHFLTIRDPGGEEYAVIVHHTVFGKYPLDGPLAEQKCMNAQNIVDALNAQERKGDDDGN